MKTAISVPDALFEEAEQLARQTGRSRSEVYSTALREYLARHEPDRITDALDRVIEALRDQPAEGPFVDAAARRVLEAVEW